MKSLLDPIKSALFGVAVGDALGVPVEFKSRLEISQNPVEEMIGYGTFHLPAGTWSDDSSLTFCLAEALTVPFDLQTVGQNFLKWYYEEFWTPYGVVFDIGIATRHALMRLEAGEKPELAGGASEGDNGNGSLMRILPLLFYIHQMPIDERFDLVQKVSSITHRHIRSVMACFYYLEFAKKLLEGQDKWTAYTNLQTEVSRYFSEKSMASSEISHFDSLLKNEIPFLDEASIQSSGYVMHTLEASIWCLLTTNSYKEAVLRAVNLGKDTDTTAAVTGGLAGLCYGFEQIPRPWIVGLAKHEAIEDLCIRMAHRLTK